MEVIHQGWLVKSPPDKKIQGPWKFGKIFKAKWRRRYFVLHKPPASASLPGSYALDYYTESSHRKAVGSIDLDQCEEILSMLNSPLHDNLFAIRTKHKHKDRTYYLSADSEAEMNKWVNCLCQVCGLKQDDENDVSAQTANSNSTQVIQSQTYPLTHAQESSPIMSPTESTSSPPMSPQHFQQDLSSEDDSSVWAASERSATPEAYIPLGNCFSGPNKGGDSGSSGGDDLLNRVPPPGRQRASVSSIPDMPPPPPPGNQASMSPQHFDGQYPLPQRPAGHPGISYINLEDGGDDDGIYKVPPKHHVLDQEEDLYKMPRRNTIDVIEDEGLYKVPPSRHGRRAPSLDFSDDIRQSTMSGGSCLYDVPPTRNVQRDSLERNSNSSSGSRSSGGIQSQKPPQEDSAYDSGEAGDFHLKRHDTEGLTSHLQNTSIDQNYDVPPSRLPPKNSLLDSVPPPPRPPKVGPVDPLVDMRYINLPPNSRSHPGYVQGDFHDNRTSVLATGQTVDEIYDFPTKKHNDADMLAMSPPPPQACGTRQHRYVNAPTGYLNEANTESMYMAMDPNQSEEVYLPMRSDNNRDAAALNVKVSPYPQVTRMASAVEYTNLPPGDSLYDSPSSNKPVRSFSERPNPAPRYLKKAGDYHLNPDGDREDTYTIFPTHRTLSFKRHLNNRAQGRGSTCSRQHSTSSLASRQHSTSSVSIRQHSTSSMASRHTSTSSTSSYSDMRRPSPFNSKSEYDLPPLPTKRRGAPSESSSSEDEEDTDSQGASVDSLHTRGHQHDAGQHMSLHSTPPPPKKKDEIQYLDLDLDDNSDGERSPNTTRSPGAGSSSPTDYKEIDFIKTKALHETKSYVESKRKSSEKETL